MSLIRPIIQDVTKIKRILTLPCAKNPSIWVEIAELATLYAAWSIITPDTKELYHRLRGKSVVCDIKGGMQDAELFRGSPGGPAQRFVFTTLEWVDKAVWWAFILEAIAEGIAKATSQMMRFECKTHNDPHSGSGGPQFGGLNGIGSWGPVHYYMNEGSLFAPVWPSSMTVKPLGKYVMATWATWKAAHLNMSFSINTRLRVRESGLILDSHTPTPGSGESNGGMVFWYGRNPWPTEINVDAQWQCFSDPPYETTAVTVKDGFASIYNSPWP